MDDGNNRDYIIKRIKTFFGAQGFRHEEYSLRWRGEVRIPLYFYKRWRDDAGEQNMDEAVVDIITEPSVSEEIYLPTLLENSMSIDNACPPKFFQLYLPRAKIYWAFTSSISKDDEYTRFVRACKKNGIGLIEVSDDDVNIIEDAKSFLEDINEQVKDAFYKAEPLEEQSRDTVEESKEIFLNQSNVISHIHQLTDSFCEEYIRRLVYYGDPLFRRREVSGRTAQNLSLTLINKVSKIEKLQYADNLASWAKEYRQEKREDYAIALETTKKLWDQRFQIGYPDVVKDFEAVLRLNQNYRDHFLHVFQVFLLGAVIIDQLYDEQPIRDFERTTGSPIEDAWLAASTYHDFGYVVQNSEEWIEKLFKQLLQVEDSIPVSLNLEGVVVRDDFLSKLKDICSTINYNLDDNMVRFIFEKAVLERNHAVLATLSFLNRFDNNGFITKPAINHASMAIFMHEESNWRVFCGRKDCKNHWEVMLARNPIMENLSFSTLPLAFLLAFCDTAQEWGRVGRDYEKAKLELIDVNLSAQDISVWMKVKDDDCYELKRKEIIRLKRFLKDPRFSLVIQLQNSIPRKIRMTGR